MGETRTFTGGCQCGAVAFEADLELGTVIACNCSRCRRLGSRLAFVPASRFRLSTAEQAMTEYRFNKHVIHHLFCSTCGVQAFARGTAPDGSAVVALNVRCLDGVDADSLPVHHYDGASV